MITPIDINASSINQDLKVILSRDFHGTTLFQYFNEALKEVMNNKTRDKKRIIFIDNNEYRMLEGFEKYKRGRGIPLTKKQIETCFLLFGFIRFIKIFVVMLDSQPSQEQKKLLEDLSKHLKKPSFLSFQHEVETFAHFYRNGFAVKYTESRSPKLGQKQHDFSIEKNNFLFPVECKFVSSRAGHPIETDAVKNFSENLDIEFLKNNFKSHCLVEFTFKGKLVKRHPKSEEYLPETLLTQFYKDIKSSSNNIKIYTVENRNNWKQITNQYGDDQSRILYLSDIQIFLKLKSGQKNTYFEKVRKQVEKALKQLKPEFPSVVFLYLEKRPSEFYNDTLFKTKIEQIIKEEGNKYNYYKILLIIRTDFKNGGLDRQTPTMEWRSEEFQPYYELFGNKQPL